MLLSNRIEAAHATPRGHNSFLAGQQALRVRWHCRRLFWNQRLTVKSLVSIHIRCRHIHSKHTMPHEHRTQFVRGSRRPNTPHREPAPAREPCAGRGGGRVAGSKSGNAVHSRQLNRSTLFIHGKNYIRTVAEGAHSGGLDTACHAGEGGHHPQAHL